jgi:pyruvate dehydrogenase E1 component beta subunit
MCKDLYVLGQGISDPFYTGDFYAQLNKNNQTRVIDAPISENLIASIGIGGAITGAKLIVIFPRMDFSLYAMNAIVNEAGQYKFLHNGE